MAQYFVWLTCLKPRHLPERAMVDESVELSFKCLSENCIADHHSGLNVPLVGGLGEVG